MPTPISGARARLYFNGTTLAGWCTNVRVNENTQLQRVDVLGDIDSQEIEPIGRTVTMTADFVRILAESLEEMGIWPRGGTAEILNFPEMSATIFDEVSGNAIYSVEGIRAESRNFTFDRGNLAQVNATFQARRVFDETGP
jgi:hypothetical protein